MRQRYDLRTLPVMPWKNGGGTTREIVCRPAGAHTATFDWRASVATIAADGAFSAFPGVDRSITLLHGGGVRLDATDDPSFGHQLDTPGVPFAFDGGRAVHATLLDGESLDFNVMTRRARCRGDVRVVRDQALVPPRACGVLHVAAGAWNVATGGGQPETFNAGQGVWWDSAATGPLRATPIGLDAMLIVVDVHPVAASDEESR
jgi:environmental stress-induced protein Ves